MAGIADLATDERRARMLLSILSAPDDAITNRVLAREGGAETIRLLDGDGPVPGLNRVDAQVWRDRLAFPHRLEDVTERIRGIEQSGIATVIPSDAHWPQALNDLGDRAPYALWARGATSFLARPTADLVTITGARAATAYGEHVAGEIAGDLSRGERTVVAGGAYGVEGAAHRAALASGGDTIAVLANGVDRPYPVGHRDLLDRIADVGLLVSEVPPGSEPTRQRFVSRGRLMGALSGVSVLVEAGRRSGALHTAVEAQRLGRSVGAVPGPVTSVTSSGPHMLLRNGTAQLVTDGMDVEDLINQAPGHGADRAALGSAFAHRPVPSTDRPTRSM